jgi:hypothetical protein
MPERRAHHGPMTRSPSFSVRFGRRSTLAALGLAAALLLAPAAALADAWSAFKGRIFVSDTEFGSGYSSDDEMIAAIKKQSQTAIKGEGSWTFHLTVFLKEPAGANKINIVYYDVTKKREQVNFSEVDVQPAQKMVQLNGITVATDLGFVKGHKYEVLATRLIGGKEKVYAKTQLTLK